MASPIHPAAAAALEGVGNIAGSAMSYLGSRELQREQNSWNMKMWEKNNEYNDPKNSYSRLLEGLKSNGLNPFLALGSSPQSMGNSGSPSEGANNPAFKADFSTSMTDAVGLSIEAMLAESQANKNNAEADAIRGYKKDVAASQIDVNTQNAIRSSAQASLSAWTEQESRSLYNVRYESLQESLRNLQETNKNLVLDGINKVKQGQLIDVQSAEGIVRIGNLLAEYDRIMADIERIGAVTENTKAHTALIWQQKRAEQYEADMLEYGITPQDYMIVRQAYQALTGKPVAWDNNTGKGVSSASSPADNVTSRGYQNTPVMQGVGGSNFRR